VAVKVNPGAADETTQWPQKVGTNALSEEVPFLIRKKLVASSDMFHCANTSAVEATAAVTI
jgi:hypothetical protein